MKLLVVSDYYMYKCDGNYYFESQEKYDFFHRYLRVFEELRLVTRCINESKVSSARIILDDDRIEYIPVPDFHGPKEYILSYFHVGKALQGVTANCDAALLQLPSTIAIRTSSFVMAEKIPFATEVVYDAEDGWKSEKGLFRKYLWKRIDHNMREICYQANGVSCVTEFYLQQHYFSKLSNSFKSHYSSLALEKSFFSHKRRYPQKPILTIAHVANKILFDSRKGHRELIDAISILKNEGVVVNVKFAGAFVDDSPNRLTEYAKLLGVDRQIKFVGFLNRLELDDFLTYADLFVLPTKAEGLPRVIIEAMAKGLPCISTNVSGNSELLSNDFLIRFDDISALSNKIKALVVNKECYETESERNFIKSQEYEASILQARRDAFYNNLKNCVYRK